MTIKRRSLTIASIISLVFIFAAISFLNNFRTTPILMYHSLDTERDPDYSAVRPAKFREQMEFIKRGRYNVLLLDDYCRMLQNNIKIPKKSVIITFDDGYKDNLKAVEILKEFNFAATIFISPYFMDNKWYLTKHDIKNIMAASKVRIGSHSNLHQYLPSLSEQALIDDMLASKETLSKLFPEIACLSYPTGGFNYKVIKAAKESGYICACTTNRGYSKKIGLYSLRRIKITENDNDFTLWFKLSGLYDLFRKLKKAE